MNYNRPGYRLDWSDEHGLHVICDTFDSDKLPEVEIVEQTHSFGFPPEDEVGNDRSAFFTWVTTRLLLQSYHEIMEFLTVDGARLYQPHGNGFEAIGEVLGNIRLADFTPRR